VSTILSLTILAEFYDLELTDDQKDKLVEGLVNLQPDATSDGSFLPEIPSLVFCMHLLQTEANREKV
jgi:hypothetical protein